MNATQRTLLCTVSALCIVIVDRITKLLAIDYCSTQQCIVNHFLTFQLTLNRGISWGMLHTDNPAPFHGITIAVVALTAMVGYLLYSRWQRNQFFLGELLICIGSLSNIADRLIYGGVIDFIKITYYDVWSWPIFNIADACIVTGVFLMLIQTYKE